MGNVIWVWRPGGYLDCWRIDKLYYVSLPQPDIFSLLGCTVVLVILDLLSHWNHQLFQAPLEHKSWRAECCRTGSMHTMSNPKQGGFLRRLEMLKRKFRFSWASKSATSLSCTIQDVISFLFPLEPGWVWTRHNRKVETCWNHKARSEWESPKTNKDMQLRVQTIVLLILVIPFIGNSFVDWIPAWKWFWKWFYSHVQLSIQTWTCMNPEYKLLWIDNAFNIFCLVSWNALQWDICLICPLQLGSK